MGVGQVLDMTGQAVAEEGERVARFEDAGEILKILEGTRGADLGGEPPTRLLIIVCRDQCVLDLVGDSILQVPRKVLAAGDVVGDQGIADVVGVGLDRARQQVAFDPGPDRLQRSARDAAWMLSPGGSPTTNGSIARKN